MWRHGNDVALCEKRRNTVCMPRPNRMQEARTQAALPPAHIIACDSRGILHKGRTDIAELRDTFTDKWLVCNESNGDGISGGIAEALKGADVCLAFPT